MKTQRKLLALFSLTLLVNQLVIAPSLAADLKLMDDRKNVQRGQAEYFNMNKDQRFEVQVNLVGGVQTPGVYHFPDNTNLIEALSLAGGTVPNADLGDVRVKRQLPNGTFQTYKYDLRNIVSDEKSPFPVITNKDTVLVNTSNSNQTIVTTLSIVSVLLSTIATVYIVKKN